MSKKKEERLRWALRYIICHPEMSPSIMAEEWEIEIDDAINICATNFGTAVADWGIGEGNRSFEQVEKFIFEKMMDLK